MATDIRLLTTVDALTGFLGKFRMPRQSSRSFDEKALTKGQLRKLNALRKSLGSDIADDAFAKWLATQRQETGEPVDKNAELIESALEPLIDSKTLRIPSGGYHWRPGKTRGARGREKM